MCGERASLEQKRRLAKEIAAEIDILLEFPEYPVETQQVDRSTSQTNGHSRERRSAFSSCVEVGDSVGAASIRVAARCRRVAPDAARMAAPGAAAFSDRRDGAGATVRRPSLLYMTGSIDPRWRQWTQRDRRVQVRPYRCRFFLFFNVCVARALLLVYQMLFGKPPQIN